MSDCLCGLKEHLGEALTENLTGLLEEGTGLSPESLISKVLGKMQALGEIQAVLGGGILPMKTGYGLPLGRLEGGSLGELAALKAKAEGLVDKATDMLAKVQEYQALFPGCGADETLGKLTDGLNSIHQSVQGMGFGELNLSALAGQTDEIQHGVENLQTLMGTSTEALDGLLECGA